jgi:hypothetical protein
MYRAIRGLPAMVEVSENGTGNKFVTVTNSYTFQQPYSGLDGRLGISVQSLEKKTYVWTLGAQTGTSGSFQSVSTPVSAWNVPGATAIATSLPSNYTGQTTTFDTNGNETSVTDYGLVGTDPTIQQTRTWSLPSGDTSGWNYRVMGEVVSYTSGGKVVGPGVGRATGYNYDSLGRLTQTTRGLSGTLPLPGVGGATRVASPPNQSQDSASPTTTLQYDAYGNVHNINNNHTACLKGFTYDPTFHQLLQSETVYPSGNCTSGLTTSYTLDRGLEVATGTVDPAGHLTVTQYDDFGRIMEVDKPSLNLTPRRLRR